MKNTILISLSQFMIALAIAALAVVIYLISQSYLPVFNKYLSQQAKQDCATSYRLTFTDKTGNTVINRPIDDLYAKCLTDKGI